MNQKMNDGFIRNNNFIENIELLINQKITEEDESELPYHEAEDFEKVFATDGNLMALVDAALVKDLEHPLADKIIYIPTKQSEDVESLFKVSARYDDASLVEFKIEPTVESEVQSEGAQSRGHDRKDGVSGSVAKRINRINTIVSQEGRPDKGKRSKRNEKYSSKPPAAEDPVKSMKAKMAHNGHGAENENKGLERRAKKEREKKKERQLMAADTNKSPYEEVLFEFFEKVKEKQLDEEYLQNLEYFEQIRSSLKLLRSKVMGGEIEIPNFDLIYESIELMDTYWDKHTLERLDKIERFLEGNLWA